ncbi:MAG: ArsI/CadI family heavy metal resistance metalloenzyme [Gammaproteobacteria bacterium]
MRIQIALNVKDLDTAIDFYSKLFGAEVNKRKPGYANFAIDSPPLKLVLNERPNAPERLDHMGVEVFTAGEVAEAAERLRATGVITLEQEDTTCCYANSEKVWATEPDGLDWEWYRVKSDSDTFGAGPDFDGAEQASLQQEESCC